MYGLYSVLKDREEPPTINEIAYASGKKKLDYNTESAYNKQLESASENIKKAFENQQARAGVREIYSSFTRLASDAAFDRVLGIRKDLSNTLQSGSLPATSLSMRSKNRNSSR